MAQATYYVNCPHCGKIVETVCPAINKQPYKVTADKEWTLSLAQTDNKIACPHCGRQIYLHWYYA
jgi:DNA-directed RNA polymerase subunit RPC12/RpoP